MKRTFDAPIEEIIEKRTSVRTYDSKFIPEEKKEKISEYITSLSNPFSVKISFKLLESKTAENSAHLGTYGVIKGANDYVGATVKKEEFALEALGYEFEKLILYITSLGLGTCWLGGTFKRGEFAKAMAVGDDELFPAISPLGFGADKRSMADSLVRYIAKGDMRDPWDTLFFNNDFATPLSKNEADAYEFPLEMVRLAPSASNKQPWRILKEKGTYHFYELKAKGYSDSFGYDIQKIDMGIAACHFHLTAMEKNLNGEFRKLPEPAVDAPRNAEYCFSWVSDESF